MPRKPERWLLPDGVDEILPPHAWRLERLRRGILDLLEASGYQLVVPPLIEYLDRCPCTWPPGHHPAVLCGFRVACRT